MPKPIRPRSCRCTSCKQITRIRKLNDALNAQIRESHGVSWRLKNMTTFWSLSTNDTSRVISLGGYVCLWIREDAATMNVMFLFHGPIVIAEREVKNRFFLSQVIQIATH